MRLITIVLVALMLVATSAHGQAKPNKPYDTQQKGPNKPRGDYWQASHATKEMLVRHGYKVVGVEQFPDGNVLYFRRDGGTSVQSVGAIDKVVIRPNGESVSIEGAPREVLADVKARLGLP
jgi:hypothetical protein